MLGLSGKGLNEQQLNDLGQNNIRTQLATIEGSQTPYPYGGKQRQIQVTWTCTRSRPRDCRPPMWSMPSPRKTLSRPPAR